MRLRHQALFHHRSMAGMQTAACALSRFEGIPATGTATALQVGCFREDTSIQGIINMRLTDRRQCDRKTGVSSYQLSTMTQPDCVHFAGSAEYRCCLNPEAYMACADHERLS